MERLKQQQQIGDDEFWLDARTARTPDAPALIFDSEIVTWSDLLERANQLAAGLTARGIGGGDRVAVLCNADTDFVALVHALQSVGAICVPLSIHTPDADLVALIARVEARMLLADDRSLEHASTIARAVTRAVSLNDLADDATSPPLATYEPNATHSILFTSGTATKPKGVVLTNENFYASAVAGCRRLDVGPTDRWLAAMPMNHVGGLSILTRSVIIGFAVVLRPKFDADDFDHAMRRHDVTIASLVPTMLARCVERAERNPYPSAFRCALIGGAGLGRALLERAQHAGIPIATTYGLTETTSQVTTCPPGTAQLGSSGVVHSGAPLDGTRISILDPNDRGIGEIVIAGPQVMSGYLDESDAPLQDDELRTGDRGRLTDDGNLEVLGRNDEVIITGGENVSPAEIEEVLITHEAVADAGVYGVEDTQWGQAVVAVVVLGRHIAQAAHTPNEDELLQWCRDRLARFKIPKRIRIVGSLPRTGSGKLRRNRLAELPEAR